MTVPKPITIFVSWCHGDELHKRELMRRLEPHLATLRGLQITCWQDQDLYTGDLLTEAVLENLDAADYGLLLLSPNYYASTFVRDHELPRFVGPTAGKTPIPVDLVRVPLKGTRDLGGVEERLVFRHRDKSFNRCSGSQRDDFALGLADQIYRRIEHDHGPLT